MGIWGHGIWQDDVAADALVRFNDLLAAGGSASDALQGVLASPPWGWHDAVDAAVQVLALAAVALEHGVLDAALRDRALATIESGVPLWRWTDAEPEDVTARKDVLEQFKGLLLHGAASSEQLKNVTEPAL